MTEENDSTPDACPECDSDNLLRDQERNEFVCGDCGLVIEEESDDSEPEWRAFDHDEDDNGLTSSIDWRDKESYGNERVGSDDKDVEEFVSTVKEPSEYEPCTYTHDVTSEEIFDDLDGEEWGCKHPAEEGFDYCVFHLPTENKDEEVVNQLFLDVINQGYEYGGVSLSKQERLRFIGAEFGQLSILDPIDPPEEADIFIDLRDTSLCVKCFADVGCGIRLNGATVNSFSMMDCSISGDLDVSDTSLYPDSIGSKLPLYLETCVIHGDLKFNNSNIGAGTDQVEVYLRGGKTFYPISESVVGEDVEVIGDVLFKSADVGGNFYFYMAKVDGDVVFDHTDFRQTVSVDFGQTEETDAVVKGDVSFRDVFVSSIAEVGSIFMNGFQVSGKVNGDLRLDNIRVEETANLSETDVGSNLVLTGAEIKKEANISDAYVGGDIEFENADIRKELDLRRSGIKGKGQFKGAEIGRDVLLMGANIDVNIEEAMVEGDVWTEKSNIDTH
jgi:hypothetical protein